MNFVKGALDKKDWEAPFTELTITQVHFTDFTTTMDVTKLVKIECKFQLRNLLECKCCLMD